MTPCQDFPPANEVPNLPLFWYEVVHTSGFLGFFADWAVAVFVRKLQTFCCGTTMEKGRKKTRGKEIDRIFVSRIDPIQRFRSCKGLIDMSQFGRLFFLELSESFFNPLIPTIRMLRNILPFGLEAKLSFCC